MTQGPGNNATVHITALAKRYGPLGAWLRLTVLRNARQTTGHVEHVLRVAFAVAVWIIVAVWSAVFTLTIVDLGLGTSGSQRHVSNGEPIFFLLTSAAYAISPVFQLVRGADQLIAHRTEYLYAPIGIRGRYWEWMKRQHRKRSAREIRPAGKPSPIVGIEWPRELLTADSARLAVVRSLAPPVGSAAPGFLLGMVAMVHYSDRHAFVTQDDQTVLSIEFAVLAAVALLLSMLSVARMPLIVRTQLILLWCCQTTPELPRGGLQDPLGSVRPGLVRSQNLLTRLARQLERHASATGVLPMAVVLRGSAKQIRIFIEGNGSLSGEVPDGLKDVMLHTVAVLAGPRQPEALSKLAEDVDAFDSEGRPQADLVVQARSTTARMLARISAAVAGTAIFIRTLTVIALIVGAWWLFARHRLELSGIAPYVK